MEGSIRPTPGIQIRSQLETFNFMNQRLERNERLQRRRQISQAKEDMPLIDWAKLFGLCFVLGIIGWYVVRPLI